MKNYVAWAVLSLASKGALAHGGGLNSEGCHNERATGGYHCHRSPSYALPEPQSCPSPTQRIAIHEEKDLAIVTHLFGSGNVPRFIGAEKVDFILREVLDAQFELARRLDEKTTQANQERDSLLKENFALKERVRDLRQRLQAPGAAQQARASARRQKTEGVATSFKGCTHFFAAGSPPVVPQAPLLRELCYDSFAILHSGHTKTPVFAAERLNRTLVADADEKRTNRFFSDARLPSAERATLDDYKGSGYARGHMAPAGDMPTAQAMAQSFSLANMVPQNQKQNSGPWSQIEKATRQYASRAQGDVYIITGPAFASNPPTIGTNKVAVPSHLFKLVYDAETKKAWAHWQTNADDARADKPISYEELTKRIGMELLPGAEVDSADSHTKQTASLP